MKKIKQIFNKKSRINEIGIFGFKQNFKDRSRINVQAIDISDFSNIYSWRLNLMVKIKVVRKNKIHVLDTETFK